MMKTKLRKPWLDRIFPYSLPIQQRLPVLICVLLLVLISSFTLVSYIAVKRTSVEVASDRLSTLTDQLRSMLEQSSKMLIARMRVTAEKDAVKNLLLSQESNSDTAALHELEKLRTDTVTPLISLLDLKGKIIQQTQRHRLQISAEIDSFLHTASRSAELSIIGKFVPVDDSIFYPVITTVVDKGKPIGFIALWRKVSSNPRSVEGISRLLGSEASLYLGNDDGSVWTDMIKTVKGPPELPKELNKVTDYNRTDGKPVFALARHLPNTKWIILLEFPQKKVYESANKFLYWILGTGMILIVVGIFLAWMMSRNITRPLNKLTNATSAIAAGDYSTMVPLDRTDEFGKLALAFNAMAAQVRESQENLEKKANDYKLLFERNPMPMWILCPETMNVVDVNEAAIEHYGYSRDEFLKLNSRDLSTKEDLKKAYLKNDSITHGNIGIFRHKKKDGKIIFVEIISDEIRYQNKQARLVLANDITKKLEAEAELARQANLRQRLITETSIEVQEREREEIGKELHDNINQILASTKLFLGLALEDEKNVTPELLQKSHQNIRMAMEEIRQLSQTLVAPSLGDITLVEAIKELIANIQLGTPLVMEIKEENYNESVIDKDKKLMLYRIIQEQISNIIKHSRAKQATIHLSTTANDIVLKIADNGVGFDVKKKSGGIGLRNMSNRAGFFNGKVEISSSPGKGCTLIVTIPIKQDEKYYNRAFTKIYDEISDKP